MSKLRSQIAIIGKQQHTCGIEVKTAYRIDALTTGVAYQIHDGLTALRILAGSNSILRLIEQYINLALQAYWLLIEENLVLTGYLGTELSNHLTIDLNKAVCDVLISFAT